MTDINSVDVERLESPRDQTVKLLRLLGSLPTEGEHGVLDVLDSPNPLSSITTFNQETAQQAQRRDRNEFKWMFMNKYADIMRQAKASPACQELMRWHLDEVYNTGTDHDDVVDDPAVKEFNIPKPVPMPFIYVMADYIDNPESGGIFDSSTVADIEMKIYNRTLSEWALLQAYINETRVITRAVDSAIDPTISTEISERGGDRAFMFLSTMIRQAWHIPMKGRTVNEIISSYEDLLSTWRLQIENKYGVIPHTKFSTDPKYFARPSNNQKTDN